MLRRSGGSDCAGEEINLSPTRISPALGSTKPAIRRSVVVLPQPDGPSRQTRWPCSMASETSSTTATSPYRLVRLRNSTDATPILPLLLNTRPFAGRHLLEFRDPGASRAIRSR